ncbi:ATP-binding protein [Sulfitobacter geojensis]|nr:ATP-binding protein [Sulfitobacter geojensis]MBM1689272.1 ATP-binding protein [Sulfitobacter geojensis]MBM1693338.1 ATP-binding protein [Sulfitobacter geojensis]MBM1717695.1 ATP-binding protein [Sulfitobacter geojensis]MBM1725827.1 ATP-binding protein [Sulfitobacter geojensis]MBM1738022.1 ATP-binding protein [Sulfitobacter geojensis]
MTMANAGQLSPELEILLVRLRDRFVPRQCYNVFADTMANFEARRRVEIAEGLNPEARGIAVIGNSGSGKSEGVGHYLKKNETLSLLTEDCEAADAASFVVPSPASLKKVGYSCLEGLGYPLSRDRSAGIIWGLVQGHLSELGVMFLHLDEAQDLYSSQSEREMFAVVNTLKSMLQNKRWPVSIILSGLPDLLTLLNLDPQLGRRFIPISFSQLDVIEDGRNVRSLIGQYSRAANLELEAELQSDDFIARLIHSAANEFGILVELITGAIEFCFRGDEPRLTKQHFVAEFRRRTGCVNDLNPFVRGDYSAIDPKLLLPDRRDVSAQTGAPQKRGRQK